MQNVEVRWKLAKIDKVSFGNDFFHRVNRRIFLNKLQYWNVK